MVMSILKLLPKKESLTHSSIWLRTIKDHRQILLSRSDTQELTVPPNLQVATRGDINGFLLSSGVHPKHIPAIVALNDMEDFTKFNDVTSVTVPSNDALEDIKKKINAKYA